MSEFVRVLLLLGLAGAAVTGFVAVALWQLNEARRIRRALQRVLGAPPEGLLIAHGEGRGAGFSFETGAIAVAWDTGAWCLVYGLDELVGAELIVDHAVAARVHRGEARRPLDRVAPDAEGASLRLIFDDVRHPDFEVTIWPPPVGKRPGAVSVREAIAEANRWLARVEAILRRPAQPPAVVRAPDPPRPEPARVETTPPPRAAPAAEEPPPWEGDDEFDEDLDEAEESEPRRF